MTLQINQISKYYNQVKVLNAVSLSVKQGHIYGLLGRNGAGKTTLMKIILGLVHADEGDCLILNKKIVDDKNILFDVGSMIETPGFYSNLTATENLRIFAKLRHLPEENIQKALELVNLPYKDKKLFAKYSLGMKQRLAIANAIMHHPKVLILDEPINGLDPIGIAEVRQLLKRLASEGVSILISSHILDEIEHLADDIGIIHNGQLIEEINIQQWHNRQQDEFIFTINLIEKVEHLLEQHHISYSKIDDNKLKIKTLEPARINQLLVMNNIEVSGIKAIQISLEDYFKRGTGGEGIG